MNNYLPLLLVVGWTSLLWSADSAKMSDYIATDNELSCLNGELLDDFGCVHVNQALSRVQTIARVSTQTPPVVRILGTLSNVDCLKTNTLLPTDYTLFVSEDKLRASLRELGLSLTKANEMIASLELPKDDLGNLYIYPLPYVLFNRFFKDCVEDDALRFIQTSHLSRADLLTYIKLSLSKNFFPLVFLAGSSQTLQHAFVLAVDEEQEHLLVLTDLDGKSFSLTTYMIDDFFDAMSLESVKSRLKTLRGKITIVFSSPVDMGEALKKSGAIMVPEQTLREVHHYNLIIKDK